MCSYNLNYIIDNYFLNKGLLGSVNVNLIKTLNNVPIIPEKIAKTRYSIPISL
jgi:hypothetical protein